MASESLQASSGTSIFGLDNVRLDLPIAGVGTRTLAAVIDYALLAAIVLLWWTAGVVTLAFVGLGQGWVWAVLLLGTFLIQLSYFAVLEIAMQGTTPGKNALGLRVVSYHGGQAASVAILVRNLIRVVDLAFGLAVMAVDGRSRRLGDIAGGTLVIHQRPPGDAEDVRLGRLPPGWGAREVVVVESFLRRAPRMEPQRAQAMAEKLLRWIARRNPELVEAAGESENVAGLAAKTDRVGLLRRLLKVDTEPVPAETS